MAMQSGKMKKEARKKNGALPGRRYTDCVRSFRLIWINALIGKHIETANICIP